MASAFYITFHLDQEIFALSVDTVKEVLDYESIAPLPMAPDYVKGIVNLRGQAIPVVDLRSRFGLPPVMPGPNARILILEFVQNQEHHLVGALADSVREVIEVSADHIAPPPSVGCKWKSSLIEGITLRGNQFILLLHSTELFSAEQLQQLPQPPLAH